MLSFEEVLKNPRYARVGMPFWGTVLALLAAQIFLFMGGCLSELTSRAFRDLRGALLMLWSMVCIPCLLPKEQAQKN